jgi:hypothetical protein
LEHALINPHPQAGTGIVMGGRELGIENRGERAPRQQPRPTRGRLALRSELGIDQPVDLENVTAQERVLQQHRVSSSVRSITRALLLSNMSAPLRLEIVLSPDPSHGVLTDPDLGGHRPGAPDRRSVPWRLVQGEP